MSPLVAEEFSGKLREIWFAPSFFLTETYEVEASKTRPRAFNDQYSLGVNARSRDV
jgi:hypothetical protein